VLGCSVVWGDAHPRRQRPVSYEEFKDRVITPEDLTKSNSRQLCFGQYERASGARMRVGLSSRHHGGSTSAIREQPAIGPLPHAIITLRSPGRIGVSAPLRSQSPVAVVIQPPLPATASAQLQERRSPPPLAGSNQHDSGCVCAERRSERSSSRTTIAHLRCHHGF